jgi:hypothetical protein
MLKTGVAAISGGSSSSNSSALSAIDSLSNSVISARVLGVVLNSNSEYFTAVGGWSGIGTIRFQLTEAAPSIQTKNNTKGSFAKPLLPFLKNYPLVNEFVLLFFLPNQEKTQISGNGDYYYLNPIGIWNSQHHNAFPDNYAPYNTSAPSMQKSVFDIVAGNVQKQSTQPLTLNLNGNSGGTFIEKPNIHPILPFAGDNIFEGRFGNSIRLGATSNVTAEITNNWSKSGANGNPITILRNGQPASTPTDGWVPITEDINTDLSSAYLTSNQQIPIDVAVAKKVEGETSTIPFSAVISKAPISPKSFNQSQVILNSGRLLFNTTSDSILLSSKKSIVLEAIEDVGIKSQNGNVSILSNSGNVSIGQVNAAQSAVLGDAFMDQFSSLLNSLTQLADALNKEPSLNATPAVAYLMKDSITNIQNQIPNLVSRKVKLA